MMGILFWKQQNAYVFHPEYHDDGKPIPFRMETKYFDFGLMTQDKKIHRIWLHSNQPNGYRLGVKLDFETKQVDGTRPNARMCPIGMKRFGIRIHLIESKCI